MLKCSYSRKFNFLIFNFVLMQYRNRIRYIYYCKFSFKLAVFHNERRLREIQARLRHNEAKLYFVYVLLYIIYVY